MQTIIPEINPGQQGEEVANLQEALIFLIKKENIKLTAGEYEPLVKKLEEEQNQQNYGKATQQVVTLFQSQNNLANKEGWIDKEAAGKLNEVLKQLGVFDDTEKDTVFIVKGLIRNSHGEGYVNAIVRGYDRNLRPLKLGETTTDEKGYYEISYSSDVFIKTGKKNPDLFITFPDENGQLKESETIPNASTVQEINVTLLPVAVKEKPEWELTNNLVLPLLKGLKNETGTDKDDDLQPEELEQADFDFITKKTGLEQDRLKAWSLAYARSKDASIKEENRLLPEIFYGWFRMGLPMELKDLWTRTNDELSNTLKEAIEKQIVPDVTNDLENTIAIIENIRSQVFLNSEAGLRLKIFKKSLSDNIELNATFEKLFTENKGDWAAMEPVLKKDFSNEVVNTLSFTHNLANWTGDNEKLITYLKDTVRAKSFRDITLTLDRDGIEKMIKEQAVPLPDGITATVKADELFTGLYQQDATGVIIKMASDKKLTFQNNEKLADLLKTDGFDIKINSIYELLKSEKFINITPEDLRESLKVDAKTTQRIALISPDIKSFTALLQNNYTSAFQITLLPRNQFVATMNGSGLPEETLQHIYATAQDKKALYEQMLVNLQEAYKGSGVAAIEGTMSNQNYEGLTQTKKSELRKTLEHHHISWDLLFGDADFCECGECTSMYSPAAYYVELLQYLRNNNLSDKNPHTGEKGYKDTPLEKLFNRRPDLGHLELTCKNTNTILPYVDLVNEVMEQWIAFKEKSIAFNTENYKGFNVAEETSGELLSAPQHTEQDKAYQTLSDAVFPFTLPYHQPVDAAGIFLNYLGSSRYELLDTFKGISANINLLNHAADAEYLGLTEKEYSIITKQNFDGTPNTVLIEDCYGIKLPDTIYSLTRIKEKFLPLTGIEYTELVELLKTEYINPSGETGQIKSPKGLLLITNTASCSLEEARLITQSIKPSVVSWGQNKIDVFLQGTDGTLYTMSWIDGSKWSSYTQLGSKKIAGSPYAVSLGKKRIDVFVQGTDGTLYTKSWDGSKWSGYTQLGNEKIAGSPYAVSLGEKRIDVFVQGTDGTLYTKSWDGSQWSGYTQLGSERIAGSPNAVSLSEIRIDVFVQAEEDGMLYTKSWDGSSWSGYTLLSKERIAGSPSVVSSGENKIDIFVQGKDDRLYTMSFDGFNWSDYTQLGSERIAGSPSVVSRGENKIDIFVQGKDDTLYTMSFDGFNWSDYTQLGSERIAGSPSVVSRGENRIDVFVQDIDGLLYTKFWNGSKWGNYTTLGSRVLHFGEFRYDKLHRFIRLWRKLGFTIDETDKAITALDNGDITPGLIHQLVAVKKIINLTGIELTKLLCFWGNIGTAGEDSLYHRLFLSHNLLAMDNVFKAGADGNYLDNKGAISQHLPAVSAALNISADDIAAINTYKALPDQLTKLISVTPGSGGFIPDGGHIIPSAFPLAGGSSITGSPLPQYPALSILNLSVLYRFRLLSKTLGLRIPAFIELLKVFGDVFNNADTTLQFLQNWNKIQEAGFSAGQLSYIINGTDSDIKPFAATEKEVLVFAKNIYDGINSIEKEHADLLPDETTKTDPAEVEVEKKQSLEAKATSEFVRNKAALLFDTATVEQIMSVLEAPIIFKTNVTKNLNADLTSAAILKNKVAYDELSGVLSITGVLDQDAGPSGPFAETDAFNNLKSKPVAPIVYGLEWFDKLKNTTPVQVENINVPQGLDIDWPSPNNLSNKVSYDAVTGILTVTGVLDAAETTAFKKLQTKAIPGHSLGTGWTNGLTDIIKLQKKQEDLMLTLYNSILSGIFGKDDSKGFHKIAVSAPRRLAFLNEMKNTGKQGFLFYLRTELKKRLIINELSTATGLDKPIVQALAVNILKNGDENLFDRLAFVKESEIKNVETAWLMPQAGGNYAFVVKDNTIQLSLDNTPIKFATSAVDGEYFSVDTLGAVKLYQLDGVKAYRLSVTSGNLLPKDLLWKTLTVKTSPISGSQLIPQEAIDRCENDLKEVKKLALLISTLNLSADELNYLQEKGADFSTLNFYHIELPAFLRLTDYCSLRNSLPQTKTNILEFLKWVNNPDSKEEDFITKISALTSWNAENITKLLSHFNIPDKANFKNEQNLLKLQKALSVSTKTGIDIDRLFDWALPAKDFLKYKEIASSIQKAIRSKYNQTDWEQVVKPLNDQLRNNQKTALIAYLLQQKELKDADVTDADGLFEYFLIDVQMDTCMETSRIKQAISSVQLFIQRCFIGLESKIENGDEKGVGATVLDRTRWEWMQRYRVWEANRKVLLYPENWIESNLRDDKSPFFKELESELLQKDINKHNVTDALKNYLYKVDEVANMEVVGLYIEGTNSSDKEGKTVWSPEAKLHVFSRTRNAPYLFYYRYLALDEMNWYPWEKMQVDIPSYDVEDSIGQITGNGCYLTPVVWNGRLLIFFPQIMKKTKANENTSGKTITDMSNDSTETNKPVEYFEIKIAWSEYKNSKWSQKQVSKYAVSDVPPSSLYWKYFDENNIAQSKVEVARKEFTTREKDYEDEKKCYEQKFKGIDLKVTGVNLSDDSVLNSYTALGNPINNIWPMDENNRSLIVAFRKKDIAQTALGTAESYASHTYSQLMNPPVLRPVPSNISKYQFVPILAAGSSLSIQVYYENNERGSFEFSSSNIIAKEKDSQHQNFTTADSFHHNSSVIRSLQKSNVTGNYSFNDKTLTTYNTIAFYHSDSLKLVGLINSQLLEAFFKYPLDGINHNLDIDEAFGNPLDNQGNKIYNELKRPYSLYNWELFFHTPIMIATALSKAQQFEEAMKWFHYVFNPIIEGTDDKRFWQFAPFKEINSKNILEQIFGKLKANTKDDAISAWRNNPFKPHLVARDRPVAYKKWVVMKYIDNIVEWGDYLYRQDTIESINQATQMYVLAGHILGRRPMMILKRGEFKPQTYMSLLDKWDANSDAMGEMEVAAVINIRQETNTGKEDKETATTDMFGNISALYFCIPNNPKLLGYWDTIADRLFKIRHCQNIEGVFRKLPLFEPPIDPTLLVKAAAQGLSISSVVNDLNTAMPNYRFYYLLQKALELCNELKSLGGAMLSAIEKKDNETIAVIRARHEGTMNNLVMEIKKLQLDETQKSLDSLKQNRKAPEARMEYYLKLAGEDVSKIPTTENDFTEFANSIEKPFDETGLRLSKYEKEEYDKSHEAHKWQMGASGVEALSAIFHALPDGVITAAPFGVGTQAKHGGTHFGNASTAISKVLQIVSSQLSFESSNAAKKGGYQRALQERIQQANAAGYELKQIDKQITAQQIRIDIANKEINNHQKQIDNANEVEEFLKNKYTNEELYIWMKGSLKTLYRQVYNLAYDLAKKAEKTYCFERGVSNANFIQSGYFDAGREGLLAGEQLYVGLKQLEAAYQDKRGYDYEITKHVSLRQLDPFALLQLKASNKCNFDIPEVLFDMDLPGHYKRRIKSVSISIPCIAGPYTSVNATLRLMNNKFRNSAIAANYPEKTDETDERFVTYNIPITAIATSSAQNDSGMFELNFKDERYLPFEGAGVISGWNLELPGTKQFDYDTISDVVLHVKYVASEGGENLKSAARNTVVNQLNNIRQQFNETGLHIPFSLKHDMPNEWNLLVKNGIAEITICKSRSPYMAQAISNLSTSLILISKNENLKVRCGLDQSAPIKFDRMINEVDLFKSGEINILLNSPFYVKGYKQVQDPSSTAKQGELIDVVDNSALQSLDDLIIVVKYVL